MKPVDFDEANFTFTRPSSMTDAECSSLRVFRGSYPDGRPVSISCFAVSDADLEAIIKTRRVWLHVVGDGHPLVSLDTAHPWGRE